jgi:hypothetical protein
MHRRPLAVELLETRTLFAVVTFTVDPTVSTLRLSGEVADVLELEPQRDGSLVAAYEGTIVADITDGVISFPGASNVIAQAKRSYDPGDGPANYGGESETDGVFSVKLGEAAIRDFRFDLRSENLTLTDAGAFPAGGLDVRTTSGILEYDLRVGGDGDTDLDDETANNNVTGNATLRGEGANRTLTLPIDFDLSAGETELRFRGTLVAKTGTGAPIDPNVVRMGDGTLVRAVQFVEADGTTVAVSVKGGGTADVRLENATQQAPGKAGTLLVSGTGVQLLGVDVVGSSNRTKLAITGKGGSDNVVVVPSLITDGAIATLGGKGTAFSGNVTIAGALASLTATRLTAATVTADSIGTAKITGAVADSTITLDGSVGLRSMSAASFSNSRLKVSGPMGTVKFGTVSQSEIYSAIADAAPIFPVTADLLAGGRITTVTTKTFIDSVIAAETLGKVNLGRITTDNADIPFGITADSLLGFQGSNEAKQKLRLLAVADPSTLAALIALQTFDSNDFLIRLK